MGKRYSHNFKMKFLLQANEVGVAAAVAKHNKTNERKLSIHTANTWAYKYHNDIYNVQKRHSEAYILCVLHCVKMLKESGEARLYQRAITIVSHEFDEPIGNIRDWNKKYNIFPVKELGTIPIETIKDMLNYAATLMKNTKLSARAAFMETLSKYGMEVTLANITRLYKNNDKLNIVPIQRAPRQNKELDEREKTLIKASLFDTNGQVLPTARKTGYSVQMVKRVKNSRQNR